MHIISESVGAGERLRKEIFRVDNLEEQFFSCRKGNHRDVTSDELSMRPVILLG